MNENNGPLFVIVNIIAGALITLALANFFPGTVLRSARDALTECEKSLPRDQHCIITAIPTIEQQTSN